MLVNDVTLQILTWSALELTPFRCQVVVAIKGNTVFVTLVFDLIFSSKGCPWCLYGLH